MKLSDTKKPGSIGSEKKRGGQPPTPLTPEKRRRAIEFAAMGLNLGQLAVALEVSDEILMGWRKREPGFEQEIRTAPVNVELKLTRSLLSRAKGMRIRAQKIFCKDGIVTRVPYVEHHPPDVNAIMAWLTNRAPERWKKGQRDDPPPEEPSDPDIDAAFAPEEELAKLSDAELAAVYNRALEAARRNKSKQ